MEVLNSKMTASAAGGDGSMRPAISLMRAILGRVLLGPIGYFLLASVATLVWRPNPRLAIALLFAVALTAAAGWMPVRRFVLWQWSKSRASLRWAFAALLSGVAFYVSTFALKATDGSKIFGWGYSAEFLLLTGLAIPFVEEFLFRALAIGRSTGRHAWIAATLAAVCFAIFHPERWLGTFIFSLFAAAFYLRGGLGAAWGFHGAYNLANYAALLWFSANNA